MFLRYLFAVAAFVICTATGRADTLEVFDLNATFRVLFASIDYQTLTGTLTIDTTIGTITATDLTLTLYDTQGNPEGSEEFAGPGFITYQGPERFLFESGPIDNAPTYYVLEIDEPKPGHTITPLSTQSDFMSQLDVLFPVASLVGYTGGTLCGLGQCPALGAGAEATESHIWSFSIPGFPDNETLHLYGSTITPEATAVPEPSTLTLIGTGVIGLTVAFCRRRLGATCAHPPHPTS